MLAIIDGTDAVCPVVHEFDILPANVYDSLVNGTANLGTNSVGWAGTSITPTSLPVGTAAGAAGGLFIAGINAATTITPSLTTHIIGTVDTVTTYTGNTPQTGDSYARLGAPSGASIDADILSRLASSGYTAPPSTAAIAAAIAAGSVGSVTGNVGGNLLGTVSTLTTYTGNTPQTGDSYSRIGSTGSGLLSLAPALTALSTAQWTNTRAGNLDNLDAAVSTRSTYAGGAVASVTGGVGGSVTGSVGSVVGNIGGNLLGAVSTLTTYTGNTPQTGDSFARLGAPVGTSIDADILSRLASSGYTAPPTSAAMATALWTDLTSSSDFATAGSVGALVKANVTQTGDSYARIGLTGSGLTSLAPASTALSTAQWTNTRSGNLDNLDAAVSTRSTYAGGAVASVTGSVGSIAGVTFPTHFSSLAIDTAGRIDVGHVLGVASAGAAGYVGLDWGQVANLSSTNNLSNTTISTGQAIQTVTGNVAGNVGGVSGAVTVGSNQDKTGYSLASTGLDSISVVAPTGVASTFPGMLVQVWRRFFKASAKSASSLTIKTFADNGTTVVTTQNYTDDGAGTETLSGSS